MRTRALICGAGRPAPTGLVGLTHTRGRGPKHRQRRPSGRVGVLPADPRASALLQRRSGSAHAAGRLGRSGRWQDDDRASLGGRGGEGGFAGVALGGRSAPSGACSAAGRAVWAGPGGRADRRGAVERGDADDRVAGAVGRGRKVRTLDVLVAGAALPPNPGELVESRAMETLLERAKSTYDLVVIDTPPLTAVSDAFPLLCKVDGVDHRRSCGAQPPRCRRAPARDPHAARAPRCLG